MEVSGDKCIFFREETPRQKACHFFMLVGEGAIVPDQCRDVGGVSSVSPRCYFPDVCHCDVGICPILLSDFDHAFKIFM